MAARFRRNDGLLTPADVYNRKLDVINRGFSGYNTEWGFPVFRQVRVYSAPLNAV